MLRIARDLETLWQSLQASAHAEAGAVVLDRLARARIVVAKEAGVELAALAPARHNPFAVLEDELEMIWRQADALPRGPARDRILRAIQRAMDSNAEAGRALRMSWQQAA